MHGGNHHNDCCRAQKEVAARAALEPGAGRRFTDAEWAAMRARLLEFADILRVWDRKTTASERGNVEMLWEREP